MSDKDAWSAKDFALQHEGHDVRIYCREVIDIAYWASCRDGAIVTAWEQKNSQLTETLSTTASCETCGTVLVIVDPDDVDAMDTVDL